MFGIREQVGVNSLMKTWFESRKSHWWWQEDHLAIIASVSHGNNHAALSAW